ncbi:MAG: PilZ domain-containing protein [Deltaproteobacteria bacterium]|nr:PilZ domain-containing protein [Deltaproteobacteria bacterium]
MSDQEQNNVTKMPLASDREYFRVNGQLYFHCDVIDETKGYTEDTQGFFMPSFAQDEDDFVGLSIDAFREKILASKLEEKDYFLEMQQLMVMMKRFFDMEIVGRKQKKYKKVNVNISGSGLAFPSDVPYKNSQVLKLSLFFPAFPYTYLTLKGLVIRSEKKDIGYEIKTQFKDINEELREEVLKFVNSCQRMNIQQKDKE